MWVLGYQGLEGVGSECLGSVVVYRIQGVWEPRGAPFGFGGAI